MSGPRQAAVAESSQSDGGRSHLLGWEAGAGGPRAGRSLVQRIARSDEHLRAPVSVRCRRPAVGTGGAGQGVARGVSGNDGGARWGKAGAHH